MTNQEIRKQGCIHKISKVNNSNCSYCKIRMMTRITWKLKSPKKKSDFINWG